jgi:RNA polymerase sigma-70 factor (ECF subfamily)
VTDDDLMRRVQDGDAEAFAALFERHRVSVFGFLARLTGRRDAAEDLLQETFFRLWRGRDGYRAAGQFRAWLFTIARRLAVDRARRERAVWEEGAEALASLPGPDRSDQPAAAQDLAARLEAALARLAPGQREVLLLARVEGLSLEEVARVTGATPGAVRVTLHRALRRLRELAGEP